MNNDVKTGGVKTQLHHPRSTLEKRTVTNRDWMKVIHFNHTTARPPSHCPRGLLYLSTFSFLLLFLGLGWWQGNCFVGRLPLKNQTTEGDIYTYCRCGVRASCIKFNAPLFDCMPLRNRITGTFPSPARRLLFLSLFFFFKHVFPPKHKWCWFCTCTLRLAVCPQGEREKELERSPIPPIHPPAFLIGLLHLLRSTNCLLGMLLLKHPIKCTHTSGTVFLEICHARHRKSSLCICVVYNQKSSSIQPGDK